VYIRVAATEDIDEKECIIVKVKTVDRWTDPGRHDGDPVIPAEPDKGVVRIDFSAGFVIRKCPSDHELLKDSKRKYNDPLLICVEQQMDAHVGLVPMSLVNFFTRTVLGKMWSTLLDVAEDVRCGKRAEHKEAIAKNRELYDWVEARVQGMQRKEGNTSGVGSKFVENAADSPSMDFTDIAVDSREFSL
jgi:hypothetical protein